MISLQFRPLVEQVIDVTILCQKNHHTLYIWDISKARVDGKQSYFDLERAVGQGLSREICFVNCLPDLVSSLLSPDLLVIIFTAIGFIFSFIISIIIAENQIISYKKLQVPLVSITEIETSAKPCCLLEERNVFTVQNCCLCILQQQTQRYLYEASLPRFFLFLGNLTD